MTQKGPPLRGVATLILRPIPRRAHEGWTKNARTRAASLRGSSSPSSADVSDPTNCVLVGGYRSHQALGVAVEAGRVYIADWNWGLVVLPSLTNVQFSVRVDATAGTPPSKARRTSLRAWDGRRCYAWPGGLERRPRPRLSAKSMRPPLFSIEQSLRALPPSSHECARQSGGGSLA